MRLNSFYLYELPKYHPIKVPHSLEQSIYDLSYFRIHVRDKNKQFGLTRKEQIEFLNMPRSSLSYDMLDENKQKNSVKEWNQQYYGTKDNVYFSELSNTRVIHGIQVHHIWPKNEFDASSPFSPNIYENFILLNQEEHLGKAHKNGSTKEINETNLTLILWKQYEKIQNFKKKNIGGYDYLQFYKLTCYIKGISYVKPNSEEILKGYIEDVITI